MNKLYYLLIILISYNVLSSSNNLPPVESNDNEFSLDVEVVKQAEDTRAYVKYLKDSGIINDLTFRLKLSLAPFTKETSREVDVFNYRSRTDTKIPLSLDSTESNEAVTYAKDWRSAIYNHLPNEHGLLGWGLYTAATPGPSRNYGGDGDDLAMLKISLPEKSRILDLRIPKESPIYTDSINSGNRNEIFQNSFNIPIDKILLSDLKTICPGLRSAGTKIIEQDGLKVEYKLVSKTSLTRDKPCHDIFAQALQELNIGALQYYWWFGHNHNNEEVCDGKNQNVNIESAFVLANAELNIDTIDTVTNQADISKMSKKEVKKMEYIFTVMNQFYFDPKGNDVVSWAPAADFSKKLLPKWAQQLPHYRSNQPPFLTKIAYDKLNDMSFKMNPDIFINPKSYSEYLETIKARTIGCSQQYQEEDSPNIDLSRAQVLFIQEVARRTKSKTVKEANEILGDCYKTNESVFIDPGKDEDIAEVLNIVGDLIEKK